MIRSDKNTCVKTVVGAALIYAFGATGVANAGGDADAGKEKSQVCASCHGEDGNTPTTPQYPKLAGQYANYLEYSLNQYRSGERQNAIMAGFASQLSKQDIRDLAAYYSSMSGDLHTPDQSSW